MEETDVKVSLSVVATVIVYVVSISAYVFGLRGDIERLEQRLSTVNGKLDRIVDEEITLMQRIEKHNESLYFLWHGCCSDYISNTVKIANPGEVGSKK